MTPSSYFFSRQKRVFDFLFAVLLLFVTAPLFLLLSLLVLSTIGYPIFFSQLRVGKNKKTFTIYKFRTMYTGADKDKSKHTQLNEAPAPMFKASYDPRFVGIGRFLSRSGLDELPQLINILKGEMSFVGPRPLPVAEAQKLPSNWNFRYAVLPGIFSEWSLSSDRHTSLASWKSLEIKTLKLQSVGDEISLITKNVTQLLKYILRDMR